MKRIITYCFLAVFAIALASCEETQNKKKASLPDIIGKPGEILVVLDKSYWDGELGNTLRDSLTQEFPYLPQVEPMYDLMNVSPRYFEKSFLKYRNLLIFNIDPERTNAEIAYMKDEWAVPQCLIQINAPSETSAIELFKEKYGQIAAVIEQAERTRVISNAEMFEERSLAPVVTEMIGGSPRFPAGYGLKSKKDDFIWISYETQYTMQAVLIYKYPIKPGVDMMSPEALIEAQERMTKMNVPGSRDNSHMMISPVCTPAITYKKYGTHEFAEIRGLWEVYGDYMGGPFVSHAFYAPDGENMILLQSFVYAPKYDKRNYLKQVESILYSFEWKKH